MRAYYARIPSFLLLLVVGCYVSSQDPTENFVDGKAPAALDLIANPPPRPIAQSSIHESSPTVTVAVIDNGVDYLHPYLADKIRYQTEGDKIVGAGWDFMGQDPWPHPNLIEASTFAFGATLSSEKKIVSPLPDPLATLDELNTKFMNALIPRMSKTTLFKKINMNSFHVLGAMTLLIEKANLLQVYEGLKASGEVLKPGGSTKKFDKLNEGTLRSIRDGDWFLDIGSEGRPRLKPETMASLDGFDDFINAVDEVYTQFNKKEDFESKFASYVAYRKAELDSSEKGDSGDNYIKKFGAELYDRWFKVHFNYIHADPIWSSSTIFCRLLTNEEYAKISNPNVPLAEKNQIVFSKLDGIYGDVERIANYRGKGTNLTAFDKKFLIKPMINALPKYKAWVYKVIEDRGPSLFHCDPNDLLKQKYKFSENYVDFAKRSGHPFLFPGSASISHASHVSGIVLAQEPNAKILPVRVLTQNRNTTAILDEKFKAKILSEFQQWLKIPMIHEAVLTKLGRYVGDADLLSAIQEYFPALYERNKLTFLFFDQIRDAISYVGKQKVKIANMSLGAEYNAPIDGTAADKKVEFYRDLLYVFFEYFKYSVGETLKTRAPNTLFVIASGNSGAALNSETKTALPCDVSSPFLFDVEKKYGMTAPNNAVTNILCVGSVNSEQKLSSFTNVLLQTNVPWVLSFGEAIESAVRTEDCGGVREAVLKNIGPDPSISATAGELEELLWAADSPQRTGHKTAEDNAFLERSKEKLSYEAILVQGLSELAKTHSCITGGYVAHAKMAGTSMATPAVAGQVASRVLVKMKELGITEDMAYNDPRFSPSTLIKEVVSAAPQIGDGSRVSEVRKLIQTHPYRGKTPEVDLTGVTLGTQGQHPSVIPSVVVVPR